MPEDEQIRLLREILRWTREAALPSARERVSGLLDTDAKKRVYEALAGGNASAAAIERASGVNHKQVAELLRAWQSEGIAEDSGGALRALFTLAELGIDPAPARAPRTGKSGAA